jgi:hypothetical protein
LLWREMAVKTVIVAAMTVVEMKEKKNKKF